MSEEPKIDWSCKSLTYNKYVKAMAQVAREVHDDIFILEERFDGDLANIDEDFVEDLDDLFHDLLLTVSFLVEHEGMRDVYGLSTDIVVQSTKLAFDEDDVSTDGIGEFNNDAALQAAKSLAKRYANLVAAAKHVGITDSVNSNQSHLMDALNSLGTYVDNIDLYIEEPNERVCIMGIYAYPYFETDQEYDETSVPRIEFDAPISIKLDSLKLVTFGNALAASVASGVELQDIQQTLAYESDIVLKSLVLPLYRDFPEMIDRIEADYFPSVHDPKGLSFTDKVSDWANSHFVSNQTLFELDNPMELSDYREAIGNYDFLEGEKPSDIIIELEVKVSWPNGLPDSLNDETKPFDPSLPSIVDVDGDGNEVPCEPFAQFTLRSRGHARKRGLNVPVSALVLKNMESSGGMALNLSLN